MKPLSRSKTLFHALIERDVQAIVYGTISYTVKIDQLGNPEIQTLKVTKSKRIKY